MWVGVQHLPFFARMHKGISKVVLCCDVFKVLISWWLCGTTYYISVF